MKCILFLIATIILTGCKSYDIPSVEESEKSIKIFENEFEKADKAVKSKKIFLPAGNNLILRTNKNLFNKLFYKLANASRNDVLINFLPTKNLIKEDKTILGIKYTNYLNIDTGTVTLDLKKFIFDKFEQNSIHATIELEGKGNIRASGQYTGVSGSASPDVYLYIKESVIFELQSSSPNSITLHPKKKTLRLKTKFTVTLLGWDVPVNYEIPLELTEIMNPIPIPLTLNSEIKLPVPAKDFKSAHLEYETYTLVFKNTKVSARSDQIELRADTELRKKQ